jgi:glycosyltransferase involved in cell wall biosynthesis
MPSPSPDGSALNSPTPPAVPVVGPPANATADMELRLEQAQRLIGRAQELNAAADGDDPAAGPALGKLIIQIPCYNEAATLGVTLEALPREVPGMETVEWLIIDDGSRDSTIDVAREYGVDHIVRLHRNQGLARAFMAGIEECLRQGADVIVNTDADNQYHADDIQKLVEPIVRGEAEMVVGARPIGNTPHFSQLKKILQKVGSWVVRVVSQADVADAPSGFRAISRATAMRLNVFNDYTYTLETLIQAGQSNMAVMSVPIRTNDDLRPSRLFRSIRAYVSRSAATIARIFMTYRPLQFFGTPGVALCLASLFLCLRYLVFYVAGAGGGHVQSLILAGILMGAGLLAIVVGLVGDLISVNRKLLENIDRRVRLMELEMHPARNRGSRADEDHHA